MVWASPEAFDVEVGLPSVAPAVGEIVQVTFAFATGTVPVESVTSATSGPEARPATGIEGLIRLPLEICRVAAVTGVTVKKMPEYWS